MSTRRTPEQMRDHIKANTTIDANGCWVWNLGLNPDGYGALWWSGISSKAYRVAYVAFVGDVAEGLVIDHLCGVRACCNPSHLEPVTQQVNLQRSAATRASENAIKTHCPSGHEYNDENTHIYRNMRYCKACKSERARAKRLGITRHELDVMEGRAA